MRAALAALAVACAAALAGGVVLEWARGPDELTADQAAAFAADALARVGLREVRLDPDVRPGTYEGDPVWDVHATVAGGSVRLLVHEGAGEAVRVEDVADDGGTLLTDDQFRALDALTAGVVGDFRGEAWVVTIAGVAGAAVALAVALALRRSAT
ncbi:MAG TPA: hypothetical protein VF640_05930 [Acidimicrobiales bacterium]